MGSLIGVSPMNDMMSNSSFIQGSPAAFTQRKASHDVGTRNRQNHSYTMGNGLQSNSNAYLNAFISKQNPMNDSRHDINAGRMANTMSGVGGMTMNS